MSIKITSKGEYKSTLRSLKQLKNGQDALSVLDKYGQIGVEYLSRATPIRTGVTADSWYYQIKENQNGVYSLEFCNSNRSDGYLVAILIKNGHVTQSGTWVEGNDFISPIINEIAEAIQSEF